MKLVRTLILTLAIFLSGCIASIHPYTKPINIDGNIKNFPSGSELTLLQPYDERHLQSQDLIDILLSEKPHPQKKKISLSSDNSFDISLHPFGRNEVLWIIPPFWTLFVNESSNVVILFPNKEFYGISIDGKKIKFYAKGNKGTLEETTEKNLPFSAAIKNDGVVSIKIRGQK